MNPATFKGGVHPFEGKELTMNCPIQDINPGKELVFPLAQHIGAPAKPVVSVGDFVLVGQKIAEGEAFISADIISSVSGRVKKIEKRRTANGSMIDSIVVENDEEYKTVENFGKERDFEKLTKQDIIQIIKAAGIVGLGGAGFPTHIKLSPSNPDKIEYVILNGAECEPYLTSDYRMMLERGKDLIAGLKIVLKLFDNAKGIIGIENNKPEAIKILQELTKDEKTIAVCELQTKYPQGGERSLINAITGRELNHKMLPENVGCLVQNVSTIIAVYDAVAKNEPLITSIVTVAGDAITNPGNFRVRIGTSYSDVAQAAGGFSKEVKKVISGGPMMGFSLFTLDVPITKTSSSLLAFSKDDVASQQESACIKCARCVYVCPSRIVPVMMMEHALRNDHKSFERINGMECIECGSCSYVCPAKRPLTQAFKQMKQVVNGIRREEALKKAELEKEKNGGDK